MKKLFLPYLYLSNIHYTYSTTWSANFSGQIQAPLHKTVRCIGNQKYAATLMDKSNSRSLDFYLGATKAIAVLGITTASLYALYSYFTRFNLKDAHSLITRIHEFIETTHRQYNREITLLSNDSDLARATRRVKPHHIRH